jgi:radical SAM superfamily enzyme YgiQ (UPF0313 family)
MNVLLVRPPSPPHYPLVSFPLGLAYLAAVLEKNGHSATIIDMPVKKMEDVRLRETLARERFGLVGISCMTIEYTSALDLSGVIKDALPGVPVVFGGPHPSADPTETMKNEYVDFVVMGEGEETLLGLVRALETGSPLEAVNGLAFKKNGSTVLNERRDVIRDLDSIPFPALHLLKLDEYYTFQIPRLVPKRKRYMSLFTSRGCPYGCIYCHKIFGKKYRARSPQNVLEEIKILYHNYGVRELIIEDDNFTMDLERAKKICDMIVAEGLDVAIQFPNGVRADRMDEELMAKLKKAGAHSMSIGIESGVKRVQGIIKKGLDLDKVRRTVELASKYGIRTNGFFMLGFPGETKEEIRATIAFARGLKLDTADFSIATPYPYTELMEMSIARGYLKGRDFSVFDVKTPNLETEDFSSDDLKKLQKQAYLSFYGAPLRLIKTLLKMVGDYHYFKRYLRGLKRHVLKGGY